MLELRGIYDFLCLTVTGPYATRFQLEETIKYVIIEDFDVNGNM